MIEHCVMCGSEIKDLEAKYCVECGESLAHQSFSSDNPQASVIEQGGNVLTDSMGVNIGVMGTSLEQVKNLLNQNRQELRGKDFLWHFFRKGLSEHNVHRKVVAMQRELEQGVRQTYMEMSAIEQEHWIKGLKSRLELDLAEQELSQVVEMLSGMMEKINEIVAGFEDEEVREQIGNLIFTEVVLTRISDLMGGKSVSELDAGSGVK